jgi:hypothetical protein
VAAWLRYAERMETPRNIYEHLQQMQVRLPAYLGVRSILYLERYLHGYLAALRLHGIVEQEVPSFSLFASWLEMTHEGSWSPGWATALLEEARDEDAALERFFTLAAEFGALRVIGGELLSLKVRHAWTEEARLKRRELKGPVPDRLQLMSLEPGDWYYLRSWHGDHAVDDCRLHSSAASLLQAVRWEYGVPPEAWTFSGRSTEAPGIDGGVHAPEAGESPSFDI